MEEELFSDEARDEVVKALNDAINIPIIPEKIEEEIVSALWSVITDTLKFILRK